MENTIRVATARFTLIHEENGISAVEQGKQRIEEILASMKRGEQDSKVSFPLGCSLELWEALCGGSEHFCKLNSRRGYNGRTYFCTGGIIFNSLNPQEPKEEDTRFSKNNIYTFTGIIYVSKSIHLEPPVPCIGVFNAWENIGSVTAETFECEDPKVD